MKFHSLLDSDLFDDVLEADLFFDIGEAVHCAPDEVFGYEAMRPVWRYLCRIRRAVVEAHELQRLLGFDEFGNFMCTRRLAIVRKPSLSTSSIAE